MLNGSGGHVLRSGFRVVVITCINRHLVLVRSTFCSTLVIHTECSGAREWMLQDVLGHKVPKYSYGSCAHCLHSYVERRSRTFSLSSSASNFNVFQSHLGRLQLDQEDGMLKKETKCKTPGVSNNAVCKNSDLQFSTVLCNNACLPAGNNHGSYSKPTYDNNKLKLSLFHESEQLLKISHRLDAITQKFVGI